MKKSLCFSHLRRISLSGFLQVMNIQLLLRASLSDTNHSNFICLEFRTSELEYVAYVFRVEKISELRTALAIASNNLLVAASVVSNALILSTLKMEAICCSESSVPRRLTRHHIPEDGILHGNDSLNFMSILWT
jgi:hypothetical protein